MENNVYLLECPETHDALLVDGCFEPEKILDACEGANIVGIVQTHGHADHVQALPSLVERLGVPIYAHEGEDYPVAVNRKISDGDTIHFGDREAQVLFTPGHTDGGVCLLIGEHLISGDTLFPGGPGNTWGSKEAFARIIEAIETKLFTLPDATRVYPGHGDDTTIGVEKPHLEEWRERGW
ncbi:MAG: MBL fold metallo-hydrolase [Actinobacteria bacterium]|jgi:glyoxylase-like metal-dependent hydrolase (beta-lactamase superfamily II)|nr:MBL fold metallo-hydrolase [Actinomycetota bacterium]